MAQILDKNISASTSVSRMVEDVIGCKWSLSVLSQVRSGVNRPGAMEHAVAGLTAKVLNERLRKLTRYGILTKTAYPEIPPHVEYHLTPFGERFIGVLDHVADLQQQLDADEGGADLLNEKATKTESRPV